MQVDVDHFPMNTIEVRNHKVLILLHQAEATKGNDVVMAEKRLKEKVLLDKTPKFLVETSMLGATQDERHRLYQNQTFQF
jgi:hypothetical protein